ncbi:MAG TPA: hypothetical protein PLC45_06870 [Chitinophagaceae bacterium]|nr:hypothetical protein [Chitinophagaceae bacterium]
MAKNTQPHRGDILVAKIQCIKHPAPSGRQFGSPSGRHFHPHSKKITASHWRR